MTLRRIATLVLAAGLALAVALPAHAGVGDPNDTSGVLDIDGGYVTRMPDGRVKVSVNTFATWEASLLAKTGHNRIFVSIDTDQDGTADFTGVAYASHGYRLLDFSGPHSQFESLLWKHRTGTQFLSLLPASTPFTPVHAFDVWFRSRYVHGGACSSGCIDRFPDTGALTVPAAV